MHGSRSKIPGKKSRQAALRGGILIPALKGYHQALSAFPFAYNDESPPKLFITVQFLSHRENIPCPLPRPTSHGFTIGLLLVIVKLIQNRGNVTKYSFSVIAGGEYI
jgi:hypothetical protein